MKNGRLSEGKVSSVSIDSGNLSTQHDSTYLQILIEKFQKRFFAGISIVTCELLEPDLRVMCRRVGKGEEICFQIFQFLGAT